MRPQQTAGYRIASGVLTLMVIGCSPSPEATSFVRRVSLEASGQPERRAATRASDDITRVAPDYQSIDEASPIVASTMSYVAAAEAFSDRRFKDAARLFSQYAERHPDVVWGHFMHGLSRRKDGDIGGAETAFRQALSVSVDHLKSLQNLARVLIEQRRLEDATDVLLSSVDVEPTSNVNYRLLGRLFHVQGDTIRAIDAYRHAVVLHDRDVWAMNNLAVLFIEQGRYEDALRPLARAVGLRDDIPVFHNNLGMAMEGVGRVRRAREAFRSALLLDPAYNRALVNLERVGVRVASAVDIPVDAGVVAVRFERDLEMLGGRHPR